MMGNNNRVQITEPNILANDCFKTNNGNNPPNAIVGNKIESEIKLKKLDIFILINLLRLNNNEYTIESIMLETINATAEANAIFLTVLFIK